MKRSKAFLSILLIFVLTSIQLADTGIMVKAAEVSQEGAVDILSEDTAPEAETPEMSQEESRTGEIEESKESEQPCGDPEEEEVLPESIDGYDGEVTVESDPSSVALDLAGENSVRIKVTEAGRTGTSISMGAGLYEGDDCFTVYASNEENTSKYFYVEGKTPGTGAFRVTVYDRMTSTPTALASVRITVTVTCSHSYSAYTVHPASGDTPAQLEKICAYCDNRLFSDIEEMDVQPPVIYTQPKNAEYTAGKPSQKLKIEAYSYDEGSLGSEWFVNTKNSRSGGKKVGEGFEYLPPTDIAGDYYYYAVVTNTKDGKTNTAASEIAFVKVVDNEAYFKFSYYEKGDYYTVTKYLGDDEDVVIPDQYKGKPVKKIDSNAFYENKTIKTVRLPKNLEYIETNAFARSSLTSLELPDTVKTIGREAFSVCSSLTSVSLNDGLETIGSKAFTTCENLPTVRIPCTVTQIGSEAFNFCSKLDNVRVCTPKCSIGADAFRYCTKLKDIYFCSDKENINLSTHAFEYCRTKLYIHYPEGGANGWTDGVLQMLRLNCGFNTIYYGNTFKPVEYAVASIEDTDYTYNGIAHKPEVSVQYGSTKLTGGQDYTLTYENNVGAGRAKAVITGKAPYSGVVTLPFDIAKKTQTIDPGSEKIELYMGDTRALDITGQGYRTITSADPSILYVNSDDVLVGKKDGETTVTVSFSGDENYAPAECVISVKVLYKEPKKYTLTVKGGTGGGRYPAYETVHIAAAPETGYIFREWKGVDELEFTSGSKDTPEADFLMPERDLDIEAACDIKWIELHYDPNLQGTTEIHTEKVMEGRSVSQPWIPSAEGLKFMGWYREKDCENYFDMSTPITSELTLYARWISADINTYTVMFDLNGREGTPPSPQTVEEGEKVIYPRDPEAEGFSFMGWYLDPTCKELYDFNAPVTKELILYAFWKEAAAVSAFNAEFTDTAKDPYDGLVYNNGTGHYEWVYTGAAIKPPVTVTDSLGRLLKEGRDYSLSYKKNVNVQAKPAQVIIKGKGNYSGKKILEFYIVKADLAKAWQKKLLVMSPVQSVISGKKLSPVIVYCGKQLRSKDFGVTPAGKVTAATTASIQGKGKNFTGSITGISVNAVSAADYKAACIRVTLKPEKHYYNGFSQVLSGSELQVTAGANMLQKDRDYQMFYGNNVDAGKASVTVIGTGKYLGTVNKAFTILPGKTADITAVIPAVTAYAPGGAMPDIEVKAGSTLLVEGKDYKLTCSKNKKKGKGAYKIIFMGNYRGHKKLTGTFEIGAASFAGASVVAPDMVYTGPGKFFPAPVVTVDGVFVSGRDYTVKYFDGNKELSSGDVTDLGGDPSKQITVKVMGKNNFKEESADVDGSFRILKVSENAVDLSKARIVAKGTSKKVKACEYTGQAIVPEVDVQIKVGGRWINVDPERYSVTAMNNINKGSAYLMVTGDGISAAGSKMVRFKIKARNISR